MWTTDVNHNDSRRSRPAAEKHALANSLTTDTRCLIELALADALTWLSPRNTTHPRTRSATIWPTSTLPALRRSFTSPDPLLRSIAAVSLARLGSLAESDAIYAELRTTQNPACRFNLLVATALLDTPGRYLADVFKLAGSAKPLDAAIFSVCAQALGMTPALASIFDREKNAQGTGLDTFLKSACAAVFTSTQARIAAEFANGSYATLWQRCQAILPVRFTEQPHAYLQQAIIKHTPTTTTPTNCLAALYFTAQIHAYRNRTDTPPYLFPDTAEM